MLEPWVYPVLFAVGALAGFVDSIAGGGGLITIPALLATGLPPQVALGTNKLQATFGTASATWHFGRAGLINWPAAAPGVLATACGAALGTLSVSFLPESLLRLLIPILLMAIALWFWLQPHLGQVERPRRLPRLVFYGALGLALGFYDGFFGPGTGTFWALAFVALSGYGLLRATAETKLMNFVSNGTSLAVFALAGQCHLVLGLCMGAGQLIGARLGARMVVTRGTQLVRPVLVVVALLISAQLLWQEFGG